jgi:phosphate-selective porin OprO and OprP
MNSRQRILNLIVAVATATATSTSLFADDTNTAPASAIDQRIDALDREIQELKHQRQLDQEAAQQKVDETAQKAKDAPVVTAGPEGFALKSVDNNFVLRLRGYAQADARFYLADKANNGTDTFVMRRVRPILEGTVYRDFDFRLMPDFGNGAASSSILQDAYVEWHYWPWLKLRAGKYKVPIGLEWLQQDQWTSFTERGFPTDLVPQRDVGFQVSGDLFGGVVNYAAGVFNGVVDGASGDGDSFDSKDGVARIFLQPFKTTDIAPLKGLGFGAGGSIGNQQFTSTTTNLASYKTTGQNTFFSFGKGTAPDGLEYRLSPQGYYYWGPLGLLGEYVMAEQKLRNGTDLRFVRNSAWQTEASFVLTGEDASYNGVQPRHPFDLKHGGWGAFELVARYGDLHLDPNAFNRDPTAGGLRFASPITSAQEAQEWGVGLNWYLNRDFKFVLDYEQTVFDGGAGTATASAYTVKNRETERTVFTRVQFAF